MDTAALAHAFVASLRSWEFPVPPFPAYVGRRAEELRTNTPAADFDAALATWPANPVLVCTGRRSAGDLDADLYRIDPGGYALLLVVRGEQAVYACAPGLPYAPPGALRRDDWPFAPLAMCAIGERAEYETGVRMHESQRFGDAPPTVVFEIERPAYEALDERARDALHGLCIANARDAAQLLYGRTAAQPLNVVFAGALIERTPGNVDIRSLESPTTDLIARVEVT